MKDKKEAIKKIIDNYNFWEHKGKSPTWLIKDHSFFYLSEQFYKTNGIFIYSLEIETIDIKTNKKKPMEYIIKDYSFELDSIESQKPINDLIIIQLIRTIIKELKGDE